MRVKARHREKEPAHLACRITNSLCQTNGTRRDCTCRLRQPSPPRRVASEPASRSRGQDAPGLPPRARAAAPSPGVGTARRAAAATRRAAPQPLSPQEPCWAEGPAARGWGHCPPRRKPLLRGRTAPSGTRQRGPAPQATPSRQQGPGERADPSHRPLPHRHHTHSAILPAAGLNLPPRSCGAAAHAATSGAPGGRSSRRGGSLYDRLAGRVARARTRAGLLPAAGVLRAGAWSGGAGGKVSRECGGGCTRGGQRAVLPLRGDAASSCAGAAAWCHASRARRRSVCGRHRPAPPCPSAGAACAVSPRRQRPAPPCPSVATALRLLLQRPLSGDSCFSHRGLAAPCPSAAAAQRHLVPRSSLPGSSFPSSTAWLLSPQLHHPAAPDCLNKTRSTCGSPRPFRWLSSPG